MSGAPSERTISSDVSRAGSKPFAFRIATICEGTSIVWVTRSRSTVSMKASASNARCST